MEGTASRPATRSPTGRCRRIAMRPCSTIHSASTSVALNVGGIALAGRTVAACARRLDDHHLIRPELHATRLRGQLRQRPVGALQLEAPPESGLAAEDTPRRQTEPLAYTIELADVP